MGFVRRMLDYIAYQKDPVVYLRRRGVQIGQNCAILCNANAFGSEPWLIRLGNHVEITAGVRFITHDGGAWVLREKNPNMDVFGPIIVGNNVFIGVNSIIMPSVYIGDNVVVGAGSIITRSIPDNCVVHGAPARIYKTITEYELGMLEKDCGTKRLNIKEKQEALRNLHPEWFSHLGSIKEGG